MNPNKKRRRAIYSDNQLIAACETVRNGQKLREICRQCGIPKWTVLDRIKGRVKINTKCRMGPGPVLNNENEEKIVTWLKTLAKCGFPLKKEELLTTVQKIVKDGKLKTPFKNGRPGQKWFSGFLKRYLELAMRLKNIEDTNEKNINDNIEERVENNTQPRYKSEVELAFQKHLRFPKPLEKKIKTNRINYPSAISSNEWRKHYEEKLRVKEEKENLRTKNKCNIKKKNVKGKLQVKKVLTTENKIENEKQKCGICEDVLYSDAEDESGMYKI